MAAPSHSITLPAGKIYVAPVGTTPVADDQYYLGQTDGAEIEVQPKTEERWAGTSNGLRLDDVFPIALDTIITVRCIESRDNVLGMGLMADYSLFSGAMRFTPRAALLTGGRVALWHIPAPVLGRARQLHVRRAIALPNGPIRLKRGADGEQLQVVELKFRVLQSGSNPDFTFFEVDEVENMATWMADGVPPASVPGTDPEWMADPARAPAVLPANYDWLRDWQVEIAQHGCCWAPQPIEPIAVDDLVVDAKMAISLAGRSAPNLPGALLPLSIPVEPGNILNILYQSGEWSWGPPGWPWTDAAGFIGGILISSHGGIAGIRHGTRAGFLAGVFTDGTVPSEPAPSALDCTGYESMLEIHPGLRQPFFVGNGLAEGGPTRYSVPIGAQRLFLGMVDVAGNAPGSYYDNQGSLNVRVARWGS